MNKKHLEALKEAIENTKKAGFEFVGYCYDEKKETAVIYAHDNDMSLRTVINFNIKVSKPRRRNRDELSAEVMDLLDKGYKQCAIANELGISQSLVSIIKKENVKGSK